LRSEVKALCDPQKVAQGAEMHKPWPKCPDCKNPMSLSRRTTRLDDIVEATDNSFECEYCPKKKKRGPHFPDAR